MALPEDEGFEAFLQGPARGTPARVCNEPKPLGGEFAGMFAMTPEQEREHEAWIAEKKREKDEDARKVALKDWTLVCPPRIQDNDWSNAGLTTTQAQIRAVLGWKRSATGIYAVGRSGLGKSRALWHLARRLAVDELVPMRYLVQGQIINEINRTGMDSWLGKIDSLKFVPVLLWDDFGNFAAIESRKNVLATELFDLIDHRYNHNLPMLISSNARSADLIEIFGRTRAEPIFRRLAEGCQVIDFDKAMP